MKKVGDIIGGNYGKKANLTREQLLSIRVCGVWDKVLSEVETKYIPESRALKFVGNRLTVGVASSSYLMELEMLKLILIEKYTEILGMEVVEDIKFRLGM